MSNEDYNQLEIDNIIEDLLSVHIGKLKPEEIRFLNAIDGIELTQEQRDILLKLYDSTGEAGY